MDITTDTDTGTGSGTSTCIDIGTETDTDTRIQIDIGTVPAVVPILLIPTSARVDVLSLAIVQRPVLAIEPVSVRGLAWEKKLHWCRQWCWQLHKSWDMCYYWY